MGTLEYKFVHIAGKLNPFKAWCLPKTITRSLISMPVKASDWCKFLPRQLKAMVWRISMS